MGFLSLILGLGIALVVYLLVTSLLNKSKNAKRPPLPPGPKGLPLLGNLNDLPEPGVVEAHHWLKHKDLYGTYNAIAFGALCVCSD
jgi:hypothetical protein